MQPHTQHPLTSVAVATTAYSADANVSTIVRVQLDGPLHSDLMTHTRNSHNLTPLTCPFPRQAAVSLSASTLPIKPVQRWRSVAVDLPEGLASTVPSKVLNMHLSEEGSQWGNPGPNHPVLTLPAPTSKEQNPTGGGWASAQPSPHLVTPQT